MQYQMKHGQFKAGQATYGKNQSEAAEASNQMGMIFACLCVLYFAYFVVVG